MQELGPAINSRQVLFRAFQEAANVDERTAPSQRRAVVRSIALGGSLRLLSSRSGQLCRNRHTCFLSIKKTRVAQKFGTNRGSFFFVLLAAPAKFRRNPPSAVRDIGGNHADRRKYRRCGVACEHRGAGWRRCIACVGGPGRCRKQRCCRGVATRALPGGLGQAHRRRFLDPLHQLLRARMGT